MMGHADVAREREARMMAAADMTNPFEAAVAAVNSSQLCLCLREYERAEALAAEALELSEKNQIPLYAAAARCILGVARAHLGRATEGIELIRDGIAGLLKIGAPDPRPFESLAWAQMIAGDIDGALATAEQVLQADSVRSTTRLGALRLRGELRLIQGQTEPAEADFREAIALAQKMGAKALELGATTSLARLLDKQGRHDEARSMLAEIYNWFTEGFDTADLKDAKALLDGLEAKS
jgi:tetratricopeptide (TPR) repeat protein